MGNLKFLQEVHKVINRVYTMIKLQRYTNRTIQNELILASIALLPTPVSAPRRGTPMGEAGALKGHRRGSACRRLLQLSSHTAAIQGEIPHLCHTPKQQPRAQVHPSAPCSLLPKH